jgi:purine-cytosine permease-like protein
MKAYNKIMQMFWLAVGIVTIIAVTYLGFTEGFERWVSYYILGVFAILLYFIRRFMMKRMVKHEAYLKNNDKNPTK